MRYCLLIDDVEDVKRLEEFLVKARNLRVDIDLPDIPEPKRSMVAVEQSPPLIHPQQPTIRFCDQGQSVSYFVVAPLEEGSEATASDGSRWPG